MVLMWGEQISGWIGKGDASGACTHMKDSPSPTPPPYKHQAPLSHLLNVKLLPVVLVSSDDNTRVVTVNEANGSIVRFVSQEMLLKGQVEEG